ncbi:FKBP-type peptidyl-prolyl cis-trans isomerase [Treponema pedis]|uniref:Peptidyl-prolyl cis-trans isomerase n=1 Tax=Treponema pedis TaxID=409322 RepID=A0A7S7AXY9_9SPIR|nr:FKBP-type peptidyl-prolyl cis-trans isomerase [Treponema pedis]QOW61681.1 FKBP-type peptidyl-prolyl cis-trans isomerase [Treponema pedis]
MKNNKKIKLIFICGTILLMFLFAGCKGKSGTENKTDGTDSKAEDTKETEHIVSGEEVGYAFGVIIAQTVKDSGLPINPKEILKGFNEASAENFDKSGLLDAQMILNQASQYAHIKKAAENLEAGNKFLEENKKRETVTVTESGLQYEILEKGSGTVYPTMDDIVSVNYKGSLLSGEVFDDSSQAGGQIKMPLSGIIPGWAEGLQLMTTGSKYKFYVPANLAYGEKGVVQQARQIIPPNAVLIFEIELVSITHPKEEPIKK